MDFLVSPLQPPSLDGLRVAHMPLSDVRRPRIRQAIGHGGVRRNIRWIRRSAMWNTF
jgi:hypothetical protein